MTSTTSEAKPRRRKSVTVPEWVGEWPRLEGQQEPLHESFFAGDESDGDTAARFGLRIARLRCLPWQWSALRKILSRRRDGLWVHPDVCLVCPRQQGKTLILILRILFGIFWLGETIVYSAQLGKTADAIFARVKSIIEKRPSLMKHVVSMIGGSQGRGDIIVRARNGKTAHVRFGVRSGDLGRGLDDIDVVMFDESYDLGEAEVAALTGAQLASKNAQTIYTSTSPVARLHPHCDVFAGLRRRGLRREKDLLFLEFAAPDPPDDVMSRRRKREDREYWRLASPSYGVISKERDVERFRKLATTADAIALWEADYLGWGDWPADAAARDPIIPIEEVWEPLTDKRPEVSGQRVIAISRTQDLDWWTISAGVRTVTGRIHVEVGKHWKATIGEVATHIMLLVDKWDPVAIVVEGHDPAAPLAPYLRKLGVDVVLTSAAQFAVATAGFIDSCFSGDVSHPDQPILTSEIEEAERRKLPKGDHVWDDRASAITALKSVSLAHWAVLEFAEEDTPAARPVATPPDEVDKFVGGSPHLDVLDAAF